MSKTYKVTLVERVQQTWEIQADDEEHAYDMLMNTNLGEPDRDPAWPYNSREDRWKRCGSRLALFCCKLRLLLGKNGEDVCHHRRDAVW